MTLPNLRGRAVFVEHVRLHWPDAAISGIPVTNLVHKSSGTGDAWIEEATSRIGDWRSLTRSVYLRWAITINASELAERRYREKPADQGLRTDTLRMVEGRPQRVTLSLWPAPDAADRYAATTPLIAAYGVSDLFGALEDVIFQLYEIGLRHDPAPIIKGDEFRDLRRMWRNRALSPAADIAWLKAWTDRYENWRRKRSYDGLHGVLYQPTQRLTHVQGR